MLFIFCENLVDMNEGRPCVHLGMSELSEPCHLIKLPLCLHVLTQQRLNVFISSQCFLLGRLIPCLPSAHSYKHANGETNPMCTFLLSFFFVSLQFSAASGACVGGHRTGGQRALHLRMGLLHCADCVHPQGHAHARHRLSGLRP